MASDQQASLNGDYMDVHQDGGNEDDEDEYEDSDSGDEEYDDLLYASEASAIADAYHESSDELLGVFANHSYTLPVSATSPRKQARISDNHHVSYE